MIAKRSGFASGISHVGSSKGTTTSVYDLLTEAKKKEEEVYQSNLARQNEITGLYDEQLAAYTSGGAFEQSSLAEINKQKVQDVGTASQQAISSGLYGLRNYGQEWESNVGSQARLTLESMLQDKRNAILSQKASFLEGIQEPYPDYSALTQAAIAQSSTPATTTRTINSYSGFKTLGGENLGGSSGGSSYQAELDARNAAAKAKVKAYYA